jgi:hypothetical protein
VNSVYRSLTHTNKLKSTLLDGALVAKFEQRIPFGIPRNNPQPGSQNGALGLRVVL